MKRGREYYGYGEEYNMKKRERGRKIIFPVIYRLLGRISSEKKGKWSEFWGRKSRFLKLGVGKNIKLYGNLYTPDVLVSLSK